MAIGTGLISNGRKVDVAAMFVVASRAIGCGDLGRVMNRAVVTIEAGRVLSIGGEGASLLDVASCALFFEHCVSTGETAATVDAGIARQTFYGDPKESQQQ